MKVACSGPECDVIFESARPNARYHADRCRKAAARARSKGGDDQAELTEPVISNDGSGKDSDLSRVVRKQLEDAGRLETIDGQAAVLLAKRASEVGATGTSTLIKEMTEAVDRAIEGAVLDIVCIHCGKQAMRPDVDDEVSEARNKRAAKAREAAAR